MGAYTKAIMPCTKKWSGMQANSRRLSVENFDRENLDKLIKIRQIRQYFRPSKFCTIQYVTGFEKSKLPHTFINA